MKPDVKLRFVLWWLFVVHIFLLTVCFPPGAHALEPEEIVVVANMRSFASMTLARYYMGKRHIPQANLVQIEVTTKEWCSREEYKKDILKPIHHFLRKNDPLNQIRCIVVLIGIPLKIKPETLTEQEKEILRVKQKILREAKNKLLSVDKEEQNEKLKSSLKEEIHRIKKEIKKIRKDDQVASVDSELSMARVKKYRIEGWLPNPYFVGYKNDNIRRLCQQVLMVSRLDGPNEKIVRRIIDDSLNIEKRGLKGNAYFDARYPKISEHGSTYARYDQSIRKAAQIVGKNNHMRAVLDTEAEVFQPGTCPDAALYCGWYSLGKYVDAFTWRSGAVGYHIASSECVSLKEKHRKLWCMKMLEMGIAATLGPVAEPYLQAFPLPEVFFSFLVKEKKALVECFFLSKPFVSWRMVLIGDPLYSPFRNRE